MIIFEKIKDKQIYINAIFEDFDTIEESDNGYDLGQLKFNLEQLFNANLEYAKLHNGKITLIGEIN